MILEELKRIKHYTYKKLHFSLRSFHKKKKKKRKELQQTKLHVFTWFYLLLLHLDYSNNSPAFITADHITIVMQKPTNASCDTIFHYFFIAHNWDFRFLFQFHNTIDLWCWCWWRLWRSRWQRWWSSIIVVLNMKPNI